MIPYQNFHQLLNQRINSLYDDAQYSNKNLFEPQRYILSLGGKRLRPLLALVVADLFGADVKKALPAALCVELFHNFSLIHDDILDKAPLRRGKKTVHKKWNLNIGILSGDAMLVKAYAELQKADEKKLAQLLQIFNSTSMAVCIGQQEDMDFETEDKVSVEDYKKMITGKTAVLLACSMQMGAICAGVEEKNAQRIYECGKHLGIAFQLKDDLLDVFGEQELVGKQVGGDIISNKKTFLLLKAMELAKGSDLIQLKKLLKSKKIKAEKKVKAVQQLYKKLNLQSITEKEITKHYKRAMDFFDSVTNADSEKKIYFKSFCKALMQREK
jgi:geranylgeranyl diphosphate synthase, type II